jgi:hypothetical protein
MKNLYRVLYDLPISPDTSESAMERERVGGGVYKGPLHTMAVEVEMLWD